LHAAEDVRNRLFDELPACARWAADRGGESAKGLRERILRTFRNAVDQNRLPDRGQLQALEQERLTEAQRLEVKLLQLFELARQLEKELERDQVARPEELDRLAQLTREASAGLDEMASLVRDYAVQLDRRAANESAHPQPSLWRDIRDAARCPLLPAGLRSDLCRWLEQFAEMMNASWWQDYEERQAGRKAPTEKDYVERLGFRRGMWSAFWAIQTLSLAARDSVSINELWDRWYRAWREATRDHPAAGSSESGFVPVEESVLELGRMLRGEWLTKRLQVERAVRSASEDIRVRRAQLRRADRLARTLHPCDAVKLAGDDRPTPALAAFEQSELLLLQAERYLDDFWADWYQTAVEECLTAVDRLQVPQWQKRRRELASRLAGRRTAKVDVQGGPVRFGTKQRVEARLNVVPDGDLPKGLAAVWLNWDTDTGVVLEHAGRRSLRLGFADSSGARPSVGFALRKVRFDPSRCPFTFEADAHVLFRGHSWPPPKGTKAVRIEPCRPKGTVLAYRALNVPYGAVRVAGLDLRPILFVLDCSYSMDKPLPDGPTRFESAVEVLRKTFESLAAQPRLGPVREAGLMVFGHRSRKLKTDNSPVVNSHWEGKVPDAVAKDPCNDYELAVPVRPLGPQQSQRLHEWLQSLQPWGNTPLLAAIRDAYRSLSERADISEALVVVITDGQDTCDPDGQIRRRLKQMLARQHRMHKRIELLLVGFTVDEETATVLRALASELGAKFVVATGADLGRRLREATDPRPFAVRSLQTGKMYTAPLGQTCSHLPLGQYEVRFGPFQRQVTIAGGETLALELDNRGLKLLGPALKYRTATSVNGVMFGCREFHEDRRTKRAELVFSLMPQDLYSGFLVRPAEVCFRVRPLDQSGSEPPSMTVRERADETVPTWEVTIEDWPRGAGAEVQVYWKPVITPADTRAILLSELRQPQQVAIPIDATRQLTLSLSRVGDGRSSAVAIEIRPAQPAGLVPRDRDFFEHLANLRLRLARPDASAPLNLPFSRELIESEETVIYRFPALPEGVRSDELVLWVTSWHSLRTDAARLNKPLRLPRPDE
ncbi:MAG: hypothetical protein GXP27_02415, partial [Planctomycetes bacterium]|nr:hypothetical protein [Planctomycetota bacterium]